MFIIYSSLNVSFITKFLWFIKSANSIVFITLPNGHTHAIDLLKHFYQMINKFLSCQSSQFMEQNLKIHVPCTLQWFGQNEFFGPKHLYLWPDHVISLKLNNSCLVTLQYSADLLHNCSLSVYAKSYFYQKTVIQIVLTRFYDHRIRTGIVCGNLFSSNDKSCTAWVHHLDPSLVGIYIYWHRISRIKVI